MSDQKIRIGISTCLLGRKVRYDGGHKLDPFLVHTLGSFVEYVPVCPEVEAGFPVPREAFRLIGDPARPRLVTQKSGIDHTERMETWAEKRLDTLAGEDLCGFIFKSRSPSSGMERVKVYNERGIAVKSGSGVFARILTERLPLLPVEEEGRLHDPRLRENFIIRIFAFHRWKRSIQKGRSRGRLLDFHTRHKYLLMSHHPKKMREMGSWLATVPEPSLGNLYDQYFPLFMDVLKTQATVKRHTDVLFHMMGYFKKNLDSGEKEELQEVIQSFRMGLVPLIVPVVLIRHYVRKYRQPYLENQYYLDPHPVELKLRNHA